MFATLLRGIAAVALLSAFLPAAPASAAPGEGSFTPTSYVVPVRQIALYSEPGHIYTTLWSCGTSLCEVDFADPASIAAVLGEITSEVAPGVYQGLAFQTCGEGETGFEIAVRGSVTLGGTLYQTTNGAVPLTTDETTAAATRVPHAGCALEFPFASPQLIQPDRELSLQAGFTMRNAGFASTGNIGGWGGCLASATGSVCVASTSLVMAPSTETLRLESYLISEDVTDETGATAGGELLLVTDSASVPFAGFSRRFYSETSVFPTVLYDTPFGECLPAADGTVSIKTYDSGGATYRSWFPAFQRANHTGTLTLPDGTTTIPYRAYRQTP